MRRRGLGDGFPSHDATVYGGSYNCEERLIQDIPEDDVHFPNRNENTAADLNAWLNDNYDNAFVENLQHRIQ